MVEKVKVVFNYGGEWVSEPRLVYTKKSTHVWEDYDIDLLSYIDICSEYKENLGFWGVNQLIVEGPCGVYYTVVGDEGVRKLQSLLSSKFSVLNFFAVDNGYELDVVAPNIIHYNEAISTNLKAPCVDNLNLEAATDCDSGEEDECNDTKSSDYDSDKLELFRKERCKEINEKLDNYTYLEEGMSFKDLNEARRVIGFYSVANRRALKVDKSDKTRLRYICDDECSFVCYISGDGKGQGFKIKTLKQDHSCDKVFKNPRANADTLAYYFKKKIQGNPKYKVKDMMKDLDGQFNLNVSESKMKRVKKIVLEKLEGSYLDEYNKLEAYARELRKSNPGSDVVVNISKDALEEGKRRFLRMYICFHALKQGWKGGLRPLIGLDGTFLRGKCQGILMVAVGQDSVNHFYPLPWAIVDKETKRTWIWFLEMLKASLDLNDGAGVTFMSDMQKGLLQAVRDVLPEAHQRFCVKHIEKNWTKRWKGEEMTKILWWSAWATYEEDFNDQLEDLGQMSKNAAKDLVTYPPKCWSRAFFDTVCKNNVVDNNFTESFNAWILDARHKPIIGMLEEIRVKVMKMLWDHEQEANKWKKDISPLAVSLYKDYREIAQSCQVVHNGEHGFEVIHGNDKHTVDLLLKRCTCRIWDLSGIPCAHVIKALNYIKVNPLSEVHWFHSKEAYLLVYKHKLQTVRGEKFWKVEPHHRMEPPVGTNKAGRPPTKRKREKDEAKKREGAWSAYRKKLLMTCRNCSQPGHNIRTCPLVHDKHKNYFQDEVSPQTVEDVHMTAPHETQESEFTFIPTPGLHQNYNQSSTQHSSQSSSIQFHPTSDYDEDEDSDPILRPKVISEAENRFRKWQQHQHALGIRIIGFKGDASGASEPTKLAYSPRKVTWNGNTAMTSNQLVAEKGKKIGKLKVKRGRH